VLFVIGVHVLVLFVIGVHVSLASAICVQVSLASGIGVQTSEASASGSHFSRPITDSDAKQDAVAEFNTRLRMQAAVVEDEALILDAASNVTFAVQVLVEAAVVDAELF
jgi:hypothetical protein